MVGMNVESVGKSRQTDYARKQIQQLPEHRRLQDEQGKGDHPVDEHTAVDPLYGQAFSGKGVATRCPGIPDSQIYLLDEVMSMFTQIGLACSPEKIADNQLEDQAMMSTLWSTGKYMKDATRVVLHCVHHVWGATHVLCVCAFLIRAGKQEPKDLSDGPKYRIRFAAMSFHANAHAPYRAKIQQGTLGRDVTALRRRQFLYAIRPMFRTNLKDREHAEA